MLGTFCLFHQTGQTLKMRHLDIAKTVGQQGQPVLPLQTQPLWEGWHTLCCFAGPGASKEDKNLQLAMFDSSGTQQGQDFPLCLSAEN